MFLPWYILFDFYQCVAFSCYLQHSVSVNITVTYYNTVIPRLTSDPANEFFG